MPSMRLQRRQWATYGRQRKSPEKCIKAISGNVCHIFLSGNVLDAPYNPHIFVKSAQMWMAVFDCSHDAGSNACDCLPYHRTGATNQTYGMVTNAPYHHHASHRTSRSSSIAHSDTTIIFSEQLYETAVTGKGGDVTATTAWRVK